MHCADRQSPARMAGPCQADEAYATSMKTYADSEAVIKHLDEQDKKIFALEQLMKAQADSILSIVWDVAKDIAPRRLHRATQRFPVSCHDYQAHQVWKTDLDRSIGRLLPRYAPE